MSNTLIIQSLENTPNLLALHASNPERYPHLLNSNAVKEEKSELARFDILFAFPQQTIESTKADFLQQLDLAWQKEKVDIEKSELPFTGGWFLYLGYELAQQIETGLNLPKAEDALPIAFATRFPAAVIIDSFKQQAYVVCESSFSESIEKINNDLIVLETNSSKLISASPNAFIGGAVTLNQQFNINKIQEDEESDYLQQLEKLDKYIVDGDVFQVNLSRRWKTELTSDVSHASIYHQLTQSNPGPFNALVTLDEKAIISSSPERLIRLKDGYLETRPIAGTRPRSEETSADCQLSDELLANPKERAEHIMLIDLERNDMGRVCEPGSIEVNELMVLESYQHVHHIVSNVRGKLRDKTTPGQLIAAVFPGGTITGCPKVRCMEILAELEEVGRGAYTGSLGYLNHDGSMDLNILIRTITRNGKKLQFRAGGGIVVDSEPNNELNETRAKAKGLIHALKTGNR